VTTFKERFKQKIISYERKDYTFNEDILFNALDLSSTTEDGYRQYRTPDGNYYPSVTTVLSTTKSEESKKSLEKWRKRIGYEEAEKITNNAAIRGTFLHNLCEEYILNGMIKEIPKYDTNEYHLWRQIYPILQRMNNIHLIEGALYSDKLKIAGRTDNVSFFDNELSIVDFKTSRKEKEEWMIEDYFIQESIYAMMFEERYGINIRQGVICMAIDNNVYGNGQVFIKKLKPYKIKAIKRIKEYYANK